MPAADNFLLEPVPHEEVARWIAGKPLVSREVFNELLPELKARIDPAQLKARYDAETWAEFETRAKSTEILPGQTVWSWLHGKKLKKAA